MRACGPTTDHNEIRHWAESQNAKPAEVIPYVFDSEPTVLRFMFGKVPAGQPELKAISWENFFAHIEAMGLTFVYEVDASDVPTGGYQLLQIEAKSPYRFDGKPL